MLAYGPLDVDGYVWTVDGGRCVVEAYLTWTAKPLFTRRPAENDATPDREQSWAKASAIFAARARRRALARKFRAYGWLASILIALRTQAAERLYKPGGAGQVLAASDFAGNAQAQSAKPT